MSRPIGSSEALTDEEIAEATVGEPVRLDSPVIIEGVDPSWPKIYTREET